MCVVVMYVVVGCWFCVWCGCWGECLFVCCVLGIGVVVCVVLFFYLVCWLDW